VTTVTVRLYAGLRDLVGAREITMELPSGATIATLRERLGEEHPAVQPMLPVLVCAVDEEYVPGEHALRDGDQVALIPPVSGGR
jgi:molybdopterin converting factor subunit 1